MAEKDLQSNRIICEGGLDTTANHVNLSINKPGAATKLVNFEVGLDGGYRRINGFAPLNTTYEFVDNAGAEGRILGVILFDNSVTGLTDIFAARKQQGSDTYKLYLLTIDGWEAVTTGFDLYSSEIHKLRYDVGNDGVNNVLAIVDGVNYAYLYNGTSWTQIKTTGTGANYANAGGNQAVDAPNLVKFFKQTLFIGADDAYKGIITYSAPNAFFDFTVANGAGQLTCGFPVVDYAPFRDSLYVFGSKAIKYAVADVAAGFLLKDVTTNVGCMARDSVVEIGGDLVFLAQDGFRPIAGTSKICDVQLETLSKPIHALVKARIEGGLSEYINSVVIRGKSQFRIFFSYENTAEAASRGLVGCLRTPDQINGWEFGELQGFKMSCVTSDYIGGIEYVIHGGFNGGVYRQELGGNLNGKPMVSTYQTPYLDFGDTEVRKVMEKMTIFIKSQQEFESVLEIKYDWGDPKVSSPMPYIFNISANDSLYGEAIYSEAVYGSLVAAKEARNIEGSFFSARASLTSYGDILPFSIHALVFEYFVKGRK